MTAIDRAEVERMAARLMHGPASRMLLRLVDERDAAVAALAINAVTLLKEDASHDITIKQRDDAEDTINELVFTVTGHQPEWSNLYGFADALSDVQNTLRAQLASARETALRAASLVAGPAGTEVWSRDAMRAGRLIHDRILALIQKDQPHD